MVFYSWEAVFFEILIYTSIVIYGLLIVSSLIYTYKDYKQEKKYYFYFSNFRYSFFMIPINIYCAIILLSSLNFVYNATDGLWSGAGGLWNETPLQNYIFQNLFSSKIIVILVIGIVLFIIGNILDKKLKNR